MPSRRGHPLEICITHTTRAITTIRTTERDTMLATAFSSRCGRRLGPPSSLGMNQYTLARLSRAQAGNILNILYTIIGTLDELLSVEELNDGS